MSEGNFQNRAPMPPTPLEVMSTWMFAEPVEAGGRRPNFRTRTMGNVPRLQVKTNVTDDKNNGRIDFNCDLPTFTVLMTQLRRLAEGQRQDGFQLTYESDFVAGQKRDKPMVLSTVKVGKDEEGRIYIGIIAHNRPKIRFFFGPSGYHNLQHSDGSPVSPAELSAAYALSYTKWASALVEQLLVTTFDDSGKNVAKPPSQQGGGNNNQRSGGGGGNRGSYGGGGNQSSGAVNYGGGAEGFDEF